MNTKNFTIDSNKSKVEWVGKKVTGAHNGTIAIKDGTLLLTNGELTGGTIRIDTTSIKILDVTDPTTNDQFAGHLASDDFFSSEKFPVATLTITSVSHKINTTYYIAGDLTIKGITQPIEFEAEIGNNGTEFSASGKITIDRTKYDMKFRSGNFFKDLGDTLIYNNFTLDITVKAKAA